MKKSNLLLLILSILFLTGIFITDKILAVQYVKINLADPYKNFQSIQVKQFKALRISGGNGYAIRIQQDTGYNIRVMNSRKSFFNMDMINDTLAVTFTVANQSYQRPDQSTVGLIITAPRINYLQLSGTNNEITSLKQDSLMIQQDTNTITRLKNLQVNYLSLSGTAASYFDLQSNNTAAHLCINIKNTAVINFHDVSFNRFTPKLQDSAAIVVYSKSLESIKHSPVMMKDTILNHH